MKSLCLNLMEILLLSFCANLRTGWQFSQLLEARIVYRVCFREQQMGCNLVCVGIKIYRQHRSNYRVV